MTRVVDQQIADTDFRTAVVKCERLGIGDLNPVHGGFDLPSLGNDVPALLIHAASAIARDAALVDTGHGRAVRSVTSHFSGQHGRKRDVRDGWNHDAFHRVADASVSLGGRYYVGRWRRLHLSNAEKADEEEKCGEPGAH